MKKLILLCLLALPAYSANLIAAADGNWTTAATWANAEAGAGAAQLTRTSSTAATASYVWSSAFTATNLDVLDGVLLHVAQAGTVGTVTVALSDDGGVTATREVTVNVSDIPVSQCWFFFKFASTLTADGGADYKVGVKRSTALNGPYFYRDGTAGNWARLVRTTTAPGGAPAAADNLFVAGEWTAATTTTPRAVTMDSTDSTDHGTVDVGQGGSVTFGVTAATAYVLKASGDINIWPGGTLNVGTVAAPMPATSSGTILLDCASNVQYGLYVTDGGTLVMQGATKLSWTYLASDEAVNSTEWTTADSTAWTSGDAIAIASTTRTAAQSEVGAVNGAPVGTTLTVNGFGGAGGGLAYAHSGTDPTRAEIVNLTRNVVLKGASASFQTYLSVAALATVDVDYAEFYWMGSGTAGKRGFNLDTSTGSANFSNCSMHDFVVAGSTIYVSGDDNWVITSSVGYNLVGGFLYMDVSTGTAWDLSDNVFIKTAGNGIRVNDNLGGTVSGNIVAGATGYGFYVNDAVTPAAFSGNVAHSGGNYGLYFGAAMGVGGGFTNITAWRNADAGVYFSNRLRGILADGITSFGNTGSNIYFQLDSSDSVWNSITAYGEASYATTNGIAMNANVDLTQFIFNNCSFSVHTNDINLTSSGAVELYLRDCTLSSATPITGLSGNPYGVFGAFVGIQRYGGTAGDHRTYYGNGIIRTDAVIFKTAAPSERITPSSASVKIESARFPKTVANGATATFSVWVRKSEVADAGGADYNGAQQRLIIKANPALGIDADVVGDTAAAAVGVWEELTYTTVAVTDDGTIEAVVDLDGTAGWVNVSNWQIAAGTTFWLDGLPAYGSGMVGGATGGTRSYPVMQ